MKIKGGYTSFYTLQYWKNNEQSLIIYNNKIQMKQLSFLLTLIVIFACKQTVTEDSKVRNLITADNEWSVGDFKTPPDESKIQVWYHWMNGHVSKEAVTKEMESMKQIGIGGFTNFSVGEGTPVGGTPVFSEEWWEVFIHAKKEAKRLGLQMGVMNGPGWSTSGGPWNTPENAMQEVVWTKELVKGPAPFSAQLSIPEPVLGLERDMKKDTFINKRYYMPKSHTAGYYNDIAVLAFPSPEQELKGEKPYQITKWWGKSGHHKLKKPYVRDKRETPQSELVRLENIIDITDKLDNNGKLNWNVPEGNWTILRVGYQPTGRGNHPAPKFGKGLEVDKMSAKAVDIHWKESVMKMANAGGEGLKDIISLVLIDSYECGQQNWTRGFEKRFKKAMGYDIKDFLPAIAGYVVESTDKTENFLWDFRKVISDEMNENYYKRFQELAHQNGMSFAAEHYGNFGNTDDYDAGKYVDISANEFWAGQGNHHAGITKLSSSAAHTYGRKLVGSEAFTGNPNRIFETNPRDIKAQGDWMFAKGINMFWLHGFTHSPYKQKPGLGLGTYGSHFHPRNTWWSYADAWVEYLNRCQYMLQQGNPQNDILLFANEDASVDPKLLEKIRPIIPDGFDYDFCNKDILTKAKVENGKIVLPSGVEYGMLVIEDSEHIRPDILKIAANLVKQGAVLVASRPTRIPTLSNFDDEMKALKAQSDLLWGKADGKTITQNKLGKGMVYWGKPIEEVFKAHGVMPAFSYDVIGGGEYGETIFFGNGMEFIHRQTDQTDVYFVSNQHYKTKTIKAKFRVADKLPELWDAETGEISTAPEYRKLDDGRMEVTLRLEEAGSVFVVFRKALTADRANDFKPTETIEKLAFTAPWKVSFDGAGAPEPMVMPELIDIAKHEDKDVKHFSGTISYKNQINVEYLNEGTKMILDLGEVNVIAKLFLNGKLIGTLWKYPFSIDVTDALKKGNNDVRIDVANLWVNRIIGDQKLPEDCEWTTNTGSTAAGLGLAKVPDWVIEGKESPTGRKAFVGWKWEHFETMEPLPSGLVGPVNIRMEIE